MSETPEKYNNETSGGEQPTEDRIQRIEQALEWYANKENWRPEIIDGLERSFEGVLTMDFKNGWERAQAALNDFNSHASSPCRKTAE